VERSPSPVGLFPAWIPGGSPQFSSELLVQFLVLLFVKAQSLKVDPLNAPAPEVPLSSPILVHTGPFFFLLSMHPPAFVSCFSP